MATPKVALDSLSGTLHPTSVILHDS